MEIAKQLLSNFNLENVSFFIDSPQDWSLAQYLTSSIAETLKKCFVAQIRGQNEAFQHSFFI